MFFKEGTKTIEPKKKPSDIEAFEPLVAIMKSSTTSTSTSKWWIWGSIGIIVILVLVILMLMLKGKR